LLFVHLANILINSKKMACLALRSAHGGKSVYFHHSLKGQVHNPVSS